MGWWATAPSAAPAQFDAQTAAELVTVYGPEPVGAAMATALDTLYGANLWGATGAPPGWGGENDDAADLGPAAAKLQNFAEPNVPTAPGALAATGDSSTSAPGMNRVKAAMARAGI